MGHFMKTQCKTDKERRSMYTPIPAAVLASRYSKLSRQGKYMVEKMLDVASKHETHSNKIIQFPKQRIKNSAVET